MTVRMAGPGRPVEENVTSSAPRPGVQMVNCCKYESSFCCQLWSNQNISFQEIPVPRDCNCVPKDDCQSFLDDVKYLESNKKNINLERLRIRNCGEKGGEKKVCCNEPSVKTRKTS